MREIITGLTVEFKSTHTVELIDMTIYIQKGEKAIVIGEHHDNDGIGNPDENGLFLLELPEHYSIRVWVRGNRIYTF